jgi:hypothetical protein
MSQSMGSRAPKNRDEAERDADAANANTKGKKGFQTVNKASKTKKADVVDIAVEDKDAEIDAEAKEAKGKKSGAASAKKKSAKK